MALPSSLKPLPLPDPDAIASPKWLDRMLREAWGRIDSYLEERPDPENGGFCASDFDQLFSLLSQPPFHPTHANASWVEWGSGFGVATAVASRLGWRAQGWEHNPDLVNEAQRLARDCAWTVDLALGDYRHAPRAELIFAYPWPGEAETMQARFAEIARSGDRLLFYCGPDEWAAWEQR